MQFYWFTVLSQRGCGKGTLCSSFCVNNLFLPSKRMCCSFLWIAVTLAHFQTSGGVFRVKTLKEKACWRKLTSHMKGLQNAVFSFLYRAWALVQWHCFNEFLMIQSIKFSICWMWNKQHQERLSNLISAGNRPPSNGTTEKRNPPYKTQINIKSLSFNLVRNITLSSKIKFPTVDFKFNYGFRCHLFWLFSSLNWCQTSESSKLSVCSED